ncbi:MAG: hypothetical protein JO323_15040 [Acidobacteriia bacterium]|nr:hypothetical protein [Terriglobia bacterium]
MVKPLISVTLAAAVAALMSPAGAQSPPPGKSGIARNESDPTRTQGGGGDLEGYNPNDSRPAPRLADGKPDFSGVWTLLGGNLSRDVMPAFTPGGAAIWNVPRNPDRDDPSGFFCIPDGMPRIISDPYPSQLVHKPGLLVFLYEYDHLYRIVPVNGGPIPPDPSPTWMGTSVAKWDGDTLVIDTVGFTDHPYHWFDGAGHRSSDALHIIERLTRKNFQTILYDVRFDDPKVWTKTWTQHKRYALRPNWKIMEYICEENNRTATRGLDAPQPRYDNYRNKKK